MLQSTVRLNFDDDFVLSEVTEKFETPFVVTRQMVHADGTLTFIAKVTHARDQIMEHLEQSSAVLEVGDVGDSMILVRKRSCGATPIIREYNGFFYGFNYAYGTERMFEILTFDREDIRKIVEMFDEIGTANLERIVPVPDRPAGLSKRQYEVVTAALESGYYDWPRRTDVEEIAASLNITHATFLEHLRKAERKLIAAALPSHGVSQFDDVSTRLLL